MWKDFTFPYVDEVVPLVLTDNYLLDCLNCCYQYLWNKTYSIGFCTHYNYSAFIGNYLLWLTNCKERIAYSYKAEQQYINEDFRLEQYKDFNYDLLLTQPYINPSELIHEVDRKLYLLGDVNNKSLFLPTHSKSENNVIVGLGASSKYKQYPANKLIKTLYKIKEPIILVGTDLQSADYISRKINCINLVGRTTLPQLIEVIQSGKLVITGDTSFIHIASALNKKIIVISSESKKKSEENPGIFSSYYRFRPYQGEYIYLRPNKQLNDCQYIQKLGYCCHNEPYCITQIDYKEIIEAYERLVI